MREFISRSRTRRFERMLLLFLERFYRSFDSNLQWGKDMVLPSADGTLDVFWWHCLLLHIQLQRTTGASDETLYVDVIFHLCLLLDPIFLRIFVWTLLRLTFQRHCLLRSINKIENFRNHPLRDPFLVRLLLQYDHRPKHLSLFWPYSDSTRPIQKARIKIYQVLYDSTLNFSDSNNH